VQHEGLGPAKLRDAVAARHEIALRAGRAKAVRGS
jgi:hypothetical protein